MVGKPEGTRSVVRPRHRRKTIIKMDLIEMKCICVRIGSQWQAA